MKKIQIIIITLFFLGMSVFASEVLTTGADFLKIPVGARYSALGESMTAFADDIESIVVNPGGVGQINKFQVFYEHAEWFQSVRFETLSAGLPLKMLGGKRSILPGSVALNVKMLYMSPVTGYDSWGIATETVKYSTFDLHAGYGMKVFENSWTTLFAGGTLAFISKSMPGMTTGYAKPSLDLGVSGRIYHHIQDSKVLKMIGDNVRVGAVVRNIDFYNVDKNEALPLSIKLGAAVKIYDMVDLDIDFLKYSDSGFRGNLGAEYWFRDIVAARIGTKLGAGQLNHFTWGIGVKQKFGQYTVYFDYAMLPYGDMGLTHKMSLKMDVDKIEIKFPDKEELWYYKGVDYFIHGEYEKADIMWKKVLKKNPENEQAKARLKEVSKILKMKEKESKMTEIEKSFQEEMGEETKK